MEPNRIKRITGVWFMTFKKDRPNYQGQVLYILEDGRFEVQYYDWLVGEPTNTDIVSMDDYEGVKLFKSSKAMQAYYDATFGLQDMLDRKVGHDHLKISR